MNKAAVSSFLALVALTPFPFRAAAFAQAPATGQIVMDQAEQNDYSAAMDKLEGKPAEQAPALEAYLAKYPKSSVKNYVLLKIMFDYSSVDPTKAETAADNVLAVDPNNLQAYFINVAFRKQVGEDPKSDAATKTTALDGAAGYAKRGLAALPNIKKPDGVPDDQWAAQKLLATTTFYSTIGEDALNNKDGKAAIDAYKAELGAMPPAQLTTPAALQEDFSMAQAYRMLTPPDLISCTFYATRAAALAPDQFKPQLQPLADYCYKRYHGPKDAAYDAVIAAAKANPDPPDGFAATVTPAPTDKDQADKLMADTKEDEIPKMAVSDREYVLQYGSDANKAKVWDAFKGKAVEIPGAVVIEATPADSPTVVKVAVSDGAIQDKKADFTFNMKPLEAPAVPKVKTAAYTKAKADYDAAIASLAPGKTVTLAGTWTSYTPDPIMIIMSDGEVIPAKAAKATSAKPAARPAARKPH